MNKRYLHLFSLVKCFGAVDVDIHVPENLYSKFAEMTPIFCNTEVSYETIGEHMQEYLICTEGSTKSGDF